jgi:uncharacterized OB-fold protein
MPNSIDSNRLRLTDTEGSTGVLIGFICNDCRVSVFGPATFCQSCSSDNISPIDFNSTAELYSYTIVRVPPPGWPGDSPYILAEVQLDEGPHVLAELIECENNQINMGMKVELVLVPVHGISPSELKIVYKWRPTI